MDGTYLTRLQFAWSLRFDDISVKLGRGYSPRVEGPAFNPQHYKKSNYINLLLNLFIATVVSIGFLIICFLSELVLLKISFDILQ